MMKNRRVGTLTLGVSLVLLGILLPIGLFTSLDVWFVLRLSPILLVALGGEILYYVIRNKEEKLKYDGLSIFMIICITFVTLIGSSVQPMIKRGIEGARIAEQRRIETNQKIDEAVESINGNVYANVYNSYVDEWYVFFGDTNINDSSIIQSVMVGLEDYDREYTKEQATEKLLEMFKAIQGANVEYVDDLVFKIESKSAVYRVDISSESRLNSTTYEWFSSAVREERTYYEENNNYESSSIDNPTEATSPIEDSSQSSEITSSEVDNINSSMEPAV